MGHVIPGHGGEEGHVSPGHGGEEGHGGHGGKRLQGGLLGEMLLSPTYVCFR